MVKKTIEGNLEVEHRLFGDRDISPDGAIYLVSKHEYNNTPVRPKGHRRYYLWPKSSVDHFRAKGWPKFHLTVEASWELRKKIKPEVIGGMHAAVIENVDVNVEAIDKSYYEKGNTLKLNTGEMKSGGEISSDDEEFSDARDEDNWISELTSRLKEKQEENDNLLRENERLQTEKKKHDAKVAKQNEKIRELSIKNQQLQAVKKESEEKVAEQDESIKDFQDKIGELEAVVDKYKRLKVKADSERKELQDRIKRLQMDMSELELKDDGNNSRIRTLEADKQESDMKIDNLQ